MKVKFQAARRAAYIGLRLRLGLLFFPLSFLSLLKLQEFGSGLQFLIRPLSCRPLKKVRIFDP